MAPGGGKASVEDLWARLKQQQPLKDKTRLEPYWKGMQSSSSSSSSKPANRRQHHAPVSNSTNNTNTKSDDSSQRDAFRRSLQDGSAVGKLTQALQSPDGSTVKAALRQLQAALAGMPAAEASALPTSKLGKALLRCFDARAEACRDMAVSCFTELLHMDPDATLGLLPYAMPVLGERLQCDESGHPSEPSEEVRLRLVQLLSTTMDQAGSAIAAYASEVWAMLIATLADSFHEVAMQACKVSQQLAGTLGLRLGATSKELVAALLPLATHKRYRVRIAAIEAVRDVVHQGAHEMILEMVAWRDPNLVSIKTFYGDSDIKVNFCGKLATDPHVQVRLAFLDMVGNWMLTLRERLDHEPRLLPYVLSGLCDEAPAVVEAALALLEQLGQQYEREHEKDLVDLVRFADRLEGAAVEGRLLQLLTTGSVRYAGGWSDNALAAPAGAASASASASSGQQAELGSTQLLQQVHALVLSGQPAQHTPSTSSPSTPAAAAASSPGQNTNTSSSAQPFVLPGPLKQRARLGGRLLVRGTLSSLLPALCRELSAWQSGPRAMSARLMMVSLLLAESAAEQHLQAILPALCAAVSDADAGVGVQGCAAVLGCFCALPLLLDLLQPRLEEWDGTPQRQAAALRILAAVLRGAGPLQQVSGHGDRLLRLLVDLADSSDSSIRASMAQVMQQLLVPGTLQQLLGGDCCGSSADAAGAVVAGESVADTSDTARQLMSVLLTKQLGSSAGEGVGSAEEREWLTAALQCVEQV